MEYNTTPMKKHILTYGPDRHSLISSKFAVTTSRLSGPDFLGFAAMPDSLSNEFSNIGNFRHGEARA